METKMSLSEIVLKHFIADKTVNPDEYSIELTAVEKGAHDVLTVKVTDTLTKEAVDFQMYAVEVAHAMVGAAKDWKWLESGWTKTAPDSVLKTIGKTLLAQGIDLKEALSTAKVTYLGTNAQEQPIVQIRIVAQTWAQSVSIVHLPVVIKERVVENLLDVDFTPIDVSTLGQESVA